MVDRAAVMAKRLTELLFCPEGCQSDRVAVMSQRLSEPLSCLIGGQSCYLVPGVRRAAFISFIQIDGAAVISQRFKELL